MGKSRLTIKGTGQLGGPVLIKEEIIMDTHMANKFMGYHRDTVMTEFLKVHYPGVKVNPKNIHVNIVHLKEDYDQESNRPSSNGSKGTKARKKEKSSIVFLPFRILGFILKYLWRLIIWVVKK